MIKFTVKELKYIYNYLDVDHELFLGVEKKIRKELPEYNNVDKERKKIRKCITNELKIW